MSPSISVTRLDPEASSDSQVENSILPYTKGFSGVNLWLNYLTSDALYSSLGLLVVLVVFFRLTQVINSHIRLLATLSLNKDQQNYWTRDGYLRSRIKKHLLVAPLIHKRHNKEIQLSAAISVGTIPSRLHTLFLAFYVLTNAVYCCLLDYRHSSRAEILAELRGRTGHLAVVNMIALFLFSARNNPFIPLLRISFDTFNLFHRWIGRLVAILSIAHVISWGVNNWEALGWRGLVNHLASDPFLLYGLTSVSAMILILFQTISIVRHAFYEFFLHLHQILAAAALVGLFLHCLNQDLPQMPYVYGLVGFWGLERFIRLFRIFYRSGGTAYVEALEGGACRVTFNIKGTWTKSPGHHIYAYVPAVALWMSHPFSVAWVDHSPTQNEAWGLTSKNGLARKATLSDDAEAGGLKQLPKRMRTTISCIVACRTGMTAALYSKARASTTGVISLAAYVEGPYGGLDNARSYGTVLLFAGGVGITHQISHVRDLVGGFADGSCGTRRVVLVWSVRTAEQLEWVRPWMDELIHLPRRGRLLKIMLYVTRGADAREPSSSEKCEGFTEQVSFGRAQVRIIVEKEFQRRAGAMMVGVCGPGVLADEVREAARGIMHRGKVDFWEEAFTW